MNYSRKNTISQQKNDGQSYSLGITQSSGLDDQAALTLTGGTTVVYGQTLQLGTSGGTGTGAVTYAVTNGTGEATIGAATGKLTPVKVGTVKVTATKAEDANYNAITSAEVEIHITRATPTGAPKYTAITTSGKTLADAGLTTTGSNLSVPGTVKWVDDTGADLPATTTVEANKLYKWVFTPADSANYTTLTGTIELYHKSSSSGIVPPAAPQSAVKPSSAMFPPRPSMQTQWRGQRRRASPPASAADCSAPTTIVPAVRS